MILEDIKLAFSGMKGAKLRTALSLLGIVIGVASVVAILTVGESASKSITESITAGGLDMIQVYPTSGQRSTGTFNEAFAEKIKLNVSGLKVVMPLVSSSANVRHLQETDTASVVGVSSQYGEMMNMSFDEGGFFSDLDNITRRQVIVLGSDVAAELFPDGGALGQYVSVFRNQAKSYQVVGVLEAKDATFSLSYDASVFIPYNTYQQRFRKTSSVSSYVMMVDDGYDTIKVSDKVTAFLDDLVGKDGYGLFSPATLAQMSQEIMGTFAGFLAAIAAISLVVGGIGIMNIMLVSVAERTKEIGIRKALGASPGVICGQFICEALTLTIIGGLMGIALGAFLSYLIVATQANWTLHFTSTPFVMAIVFSTVIGVFFGWYPALKASKLDPIEALNYE